MAIGLTFRNVLAPVSSSGGSNSAVYAGYTPTRYAAASDLGTGDGSSEANAMDFATALTGLSGDDVVGVLPSITITGTPNVDQRFAPSWKVTGSGSAGHPIRIVAKYAASIYGFDAWTELRSGTTTQQHGCPAFGVEAQNWVEWIGFYVNEANSATFPDTGPATLHGSVGGAIRLCHIVGDPSYLPADNHVGLRIEDTYGAAATDNKIHGFRNSSVSTANGSGIETYTSGNLTVEHNEIFDCFNGIHHKADGANSVPPTDGAKMGWFRTRWNYIHDVDIWGVIYGRSYDGYDRECYGNVVHLNVPSGQTGFGLTFWNYAPDDPRRIKVQNNTVYVTTSGGGSCYGLYHKNALEAGNTFNGNIVVAATRAIYQEGMASTFTTTYWAPDRNCYHGFSTFADLTNGNGASLAAYQAAYGGMDANAISSDPSFVDASAKDFRLAGGSPCLSLARDVLNITGLGVNATIAAGAYPTGSETIGVRS